MNYFKKHFAFLMVLIFLGTLSAGAQDDADSGGLFYIADYNIDWQSLADWNEAYWEHSVPILQTLVDEGIITGWSAWQHNSGGDYNWRMVIDAADWDNFNEFWDEYLGRLPEEAMQQTSPMIRSHRDQIWDNEMSNFPESAADAKWAYEALYQVDFTDIEEWTDDMKDKDISVWNSAMEKGLLAGWAVMGHNTGDRFNHGQVFLFQEWDQMDDFMNYSFEAIMSDEERWTKIGSMMKGHTDAIWERVLNDSESGN